MIELERTFLAKSIPTDLSYRFEEIIDLYIPRDAAHPRLRLRKTDKNITLTKKVKVNVDDASKHTEHTLKLDQGEYEALIQVPGKRLRKRRFTFPYQGLVAEFDFFLDGLEGLVLVDFEFESEQEKNNFVMPSFCLADVTQEEFIAGGMLSGKSYQDVASLLDQFGYQKLQT